ncbi:MAG: hypothetical protein LUM44_24550 [Pyrinomonadaceae bacterium]|nr:hypothetical protein [Pyrinomonadaceae bacterium]
MNGKAVILKKEISMFTPKIGENPKMEEQIFEKIETEKILVSENQTIFQGTRFARLKKSLRKRSAGIF